jgi:hypothetical protein
MTNASIELWKNKIMFLYHKIKDWYSWNVVFFKESTKHNRLFKAIMEAQLLANARGKQYYVLPGPAGSYVSMSSSERKRLQDRKAINKGIGVIDMLTDAVYIAIPENHNYGKKISTGFVKTEESPIKTEV